MRTTTFDKRVAHVRDCPVCQGARFGDQLCDVGWLLAPDARRKSRTPRLAAQA